MFVFMSFVHVFRCILAFSLSEIDVNALGGVVLRFSIPHGYIVAKRVQAIEAPRSVGLVGLVDCSLNGSLFANHFNHIDLLQ